MNKYLSFCFGYCSWQSNGSIISFVPIPGPVNMLLYMAQGTLHMWLMISKLRYIYIEFSRQ